VRAGIRFHRSAGVRRGTTESVQWRCKQGQRRLADLLSLPFIGSGRILNT
jgi:hypothetical protein